MQSNTQPGSLGTKFQDFGAAPSDALWGKVEAALEEKEKKRRGIIWWWLGSGASAALIVTLFMINWGPEHSNNEAISVPVKEEVIQENKENITDEEVPAIEEEVSFDKSNVVVNSKEEINLNNGNQADNEAVEYIITDESFQFKWANETSNNDDQYVIKEEKMKFDKPVDMGHLPEPEINLLAVNADYPSLEFNKYEKPKNRPWEIGFSVGYWKESAGLIPFQKQEAIVGDPPSGPNNTFADSNSFDLSSNPIPVEQYSFESNSLTKRRFSFTGYLGKYFSDRCSWRVGLNVHRTSYDLTNYYSNSALNSYLETVNTRGAFTSIGIPVFVQYDMIQKRAFKMRTTLGVSNEIPVWERYNSNESLTKQTITGYMGALQIGITNDIKVGKNTYLTLMPSYKFYFTRKVNSDIQLGLDKHWLGGTIGLTWEL